MKCAKCQEQLGVLVLCRAHAPRLVGAPYTVAFTGHRPDKLGGYGEVNPVRDQLVMALERRLVELRAEHPDIVCISGMALGFDQWAAETCVRLGIPFEAAIPFRGQEASWPVASQERYRQLLEQAFKLTVVCVGGYLPRKMLMRNEWMVNRSDRLVGAWDGSTGGTAHCVEYARRLDRIWENLYWPSMRSA